jgi:UDP-sugar transporter A1/2/3|tara:strand:- start:118 stop:1269 length:1152 start_codon:yes stop_codon:yes gene_type:complete
MASLTTKDTTPSWLKTTALLLLVAQNVSLVITMKVSMGDSSAPYIVTVAVLLTEMLKLFICLMVIYVYQQKTFNWRSIWSREGLKMAVPALLYVFQNNMLFFALSRLEPAVFQITYQLKIATTAMFSVLMLKRTLSRSQWVGVGLLLPGVVLVQLSRLSGPTAATEEVHVGAYQLAPAASEAGLLSAQESTNDVLQPSPLVSALGVGGMTFMDQVLGFVAVLVSCVTSGFAGVYFEKVLKSAKDLSLWERNVQLATYSIVMAFGTVVSKDFSRVVNEGPFVGMSASAFFVVVLQAAGGLMIAVVVRYTDNIAKAFATSISVIISCIISIFFFDFHPPVIFFFGAMLVGMAVRFYSAKPGDGLVHLILVQICQLADLNSSVLPK